MCNKNEINANIKDIAKNIDNIEWYFDLENCTDKFENIKIEEEIKICNRALELCVERCIEENFNIKDWMLIDASSTKDKLLILSFYNETEKKNLVFGIYKDDVIPYSLIDGVQYPRNLIRKAIYEDTNVDYLYITIRKRGIIYKEKSRDIKIEIDSTIKDLSSKIFTSKYYKKLDDDSIKSYDKKQLMHIEKEKRQLELCVERCIEEHFPIENWYLSDLEYVNNDITVVSFFNKESKEEIMFTVYSDGYAIPFFYECGQLYYSNTVKGAVV